MVSDVDSGQIRQRGRAHGHAEIQHGGFNGRAVDPIRRQVDRAAQQTAQLSGHIKSRPVIDDDGYFFDGPGKGNAGRQGLVGGFLAHR